MDTRHERAVAVVGLGAILPDAPDAAAFWRNICEKRYSIGDVPHDRWSVADYYDPDPSAPDKTYSKIGSWVRGFAFDWKHFHIPPRVAAAMDEGQQWAVTIAAAALADYGYPRRALDAERTGVIFGTAMGGELHYLTHLRIAFPEFARALGSVKEFSALPGDVRDAILRHWHERVDKTFPPVTEDSMPGELPNVLSGRIANVLNLRGPNFITDAACASSFAAIDASIDLLVERQCDAVITGGVDRNMGASTFVKFCKIGALSATGTRPFADGADGFVMGEGCAAFLLKRLADAERDGDCIYAVIRGIGGSSDGKGKGITAPNPAGQRLAMERAWQDAGLDPCSATLVEAHGTSTRVGDVVEVESLAAVFKNAPRGSLALGSAKSNIGHLKAGAGAAGLLKTIFALHHKILPPTLNCERPNPAIDFSETPFYPNTETREWTPRNGTPRRAAVSAYGFGGTNFHLALEEHRPGELTRRAPIVPVPGDVPKGGPTSDAPHAKPPLRGIAMLGADSPAALKDALDAYLARVREGFVPPVTRPEAVVLAARERIAIDFGSAPELLDKLQKAQRALGFDTSQAWRALQAQGIFRGSGPRVGKLAFLFPGQGSQWVNMGRDLAAVEPAAAQVFTEADAVTGPLLGRPLTSFLFVADADADAAARAEEDLKQTAITQPAVLAVDEAVRRVLAEYGFEPEYVMGHSLGEYAALVTAGIIPFAHAIEAAAARGREMTAVSVGDNGWMAAVMAPPALVEQVLSTIDEYVVAANLNSRTQCVIGGSTEGVRRAIASFTEKGIQAIQLNVSHAFHTRIVAQASEPLRRVLDRLQITPPVKKMVANVTGELYPTTVPEIKDLLTQQIAAPVQWAKGLETLYAEGVRTFVEVGPKKALKGFVDDVLGDRPDVVSLFTNHPKPGEIIAFNQALCGMYAAGWGAPIEREIMAVAAAASTSPPEAARRDAPPPTPAGTIATSAPPVAHLGPPASPAAGPASAVVASPLLSPAAASGPQPPVLGATPMTWDPNVATLESLARLVAQTLAQTTGHAQPASDRNTAPQGSVVVTGCGLGLPGAEKAVMDPANAERILRGEQFVDLVPERYRAQMAGKRVTRLVKGDDGSGRFETIEATEDVIKLAGRPGAFDLAAEYGVPDRLIEALDTTTQLAMAAGLDALREAGIPLVQSWKKTTTGKYLPDRWMLPEALRDETGVIFASAFPGLDRFTEQVTQYFAYQERRHRREVLEDLRRYTKDAETLSEIHRRLSEVEAELQREPYGFDRRFLLRVLSMGHSQFSEYIGARGPNTHVNAACASTALAIGLAEDWIRSGRCRRVIVVGGDNVTSDHLFEWMGAGFLASGAAATDDKVADAAIPFDRRRHGTLLGMGACALVIESQDTVDERGMRGIVEVLSSEVRNSAFHATRLDIDHVSRTMDSLLTSAERRFGLNRLHIAPETVFVSHETYTPARGGSASAEVAALRHAFGDAARDVVIANTKGFTGHAMGVGVEDVIAVKILEHGIVPPVPNLKEIDPELGPLTLSRGGRYPVKYAIHLAAGFGSQIALTMIRRVPGSLDRIDNRPLYDHWLADMSGYERAETEVFKRVLRVVSKGVPARAPAPSLWTYGLGPTRRAPAPGDGVVSARPLPLAMPAPGAQPVVPAAPVLPSVAVATSVAPPVVRPVPAPVLPASTPPAIPAPAVAPSAPMAVQSTPGVPPAPAPIPELETPAAAAASASAQSDPVADRVVAIVAEKTGYPADMLEMDLDLEADLGVDTVKQAETFAAVREAYDIARVDNLKLRDFPTLRRVVQFVYDHRPDLVAAPVAPAPASPASAPAPEAAVMPPAPPIGASPESAAMQSDAVTERVLAIVADKTGYPPDMLELDLDLEADLGVDTVKQAETFAAVREAYDIPRQDNLKLRDFPTLRHVVGFVFAHRPDLAAPPEAPAPASGPAPAPAPSAETIPASPAEVTSAATGVAEPAVARTTATIQGRLEDADRVPRRVVVPVLRPPLAFCKATPVTLGPGRRVVVAQDEEGVGAALESILEARGVQTLSFSADTDGVELDHLIRTWMSEGPIHGLFWLPGLDTEPSLGGLDLASFRTLTQRRIKRLAAVMRVLYDEISTPDRFLATATRMGGLHGQGRDGATAPLGGGIAGFTKAYRRERSGPLAKVVDFSALIGPDETAKILVDEVLADPGAVEVGYRDGLRWTVSLEEQAVADGGPGLALGRDTVFVVTGAAGGITSAIVADLARESAGTFYLLDLVPRPDPADPKIALFRTDRERLKLALIDEMRARGEKPTPVIIDRQLMAIERSEAALRVVQDVEQAGGGAHYRAVNLLDASAIDAVVDEIRQRHGRIDVLLHAGGIEVSHALPEKPQEEFDRVFDIKVEGLFNLLKAAQNVPIGATVVFSSVAGRFGNSGQTDYSAANGFLCAASRYLRCVQPATRAIAVDWSAWGGIGMATRGSIPTIMEAAGIEMLPPEVGVPTIRRELTAGSTSDEVVVGGRLGVLVQEWDPTGGLDPEKVREWLARDDRRAIMVGAVSAAPLYGHLEVETLLDPELQPFLRDHRIDGTPVLPGVMGTEGFAELATLLAPDWAVADVQQVQFMLPFKFFHMEPTVLHFSAVGRPGPSGDVVVEGTLRSRVQPKPDRPAMERVHFKATVRLSRVRPSAPRPKPLADTGPSRVVPREDIYKLYFHGPAYKVLDQVRVAEGTAIGVMAEQLPPDTSPAPARLVMAPRLIELCFQTAGILEVSQKETLGLPTAMRSVSVYRTAEEANGRRLFAVVQGNGRTEEYDARVVDESGNVYVEVEGYRTIALAGRHALDPPGA